MKITVLSGGLLDKFLNSLSYKNYKYNSIVFKKNNSVI